MINIQEINKIDTNPYFQKLNTTKIENFLKSQECFIDAVDNWSKVLGILLSKVPTFKERAIIIDNLYDEHGEGNIVNSHVNTFSKFMKSLGYEEDLLINNDNLPSHNHVKSFNDSLLEKVNNESWLFSVAMLGMIEYTYITVSKNIHKYVAQFIISEDIHHYSLHEIVDVKHATDLFELILPYENIKTEMIINGLITGYNLLAKLYDDLSQFL